MQTRDGRTVAAVQFTWANGGMYYLRLATTRVIAGEEYPEIIDFPAGCNVANTPLAEEDFREVNRIANRLTGHWHAL